MHHWCKTKKRPVHIKDSLPDSPFPITYKSLNIKLKHFGTAPGLVDRMFTVHAGSRGFDPHRQHMSEQFFRSNRLGYPHPVSAELENSGIRVAVGDCSVTECHRWHPP